MGGQFCTNHTVFCPPEPRLDAFTHRNEVYTLGFITAVKWDAYDVENTAGNARRCNLGRQSPSPFHCSYRAEVFIWQNFQPTYQDPGCKESQFLQPALQASCS